MLLAEQAGGRDAEGRPLTVSARLAKPSDVAEMIKSLYGIGADTVEGVLGAEGEAEVAVLGREVVDLTGATASGEDAAIIRFVNEIMLEGVKIGASDIHFEPFEKDLRVRYRLDGVLREEPVPERIKHLEAAIISRIKIMAGMDIAEKRLPQDGQIRLKVMGRFIDVRVCRCCRRCLGRGWRCVCWIVRWLFGGWIVWGCRRIICVCTERRSSCRMG